MITDDVFDEPPCATCPHFARCSLGLACQQFESFYSVGGRKYRTLPREPSAEIYRRLFKIEAKVAAAITANRLQVSR